MADFELIEWTKGKINENCGQIEMGREAWKIRCPFCGDSKKSARKKRGNYYLEDGMYKCYNGECQIYCDSFRLVAELESKPLSQVKADFFKHEKSGGGDFEYVQELQPKHTNNEPEKFVVPSSWTMLTDELKEYVHSRMLQTAPNVQGELLLFYNTESRRLVIPWIMNGKIAYYQERALSPHQQPKYLFPKATTGRPLYGIDNVSSSYPWIFYLEGALDSIWVKNGTAAGSISLSSTQSETLSNYIEHEVVYFPDNPWVDKAARENIRKLSETHKGLKVWMWPKGIQEKDVNELVCNRNDPMMFYHEKLHENVISVQKARCILELSVL